MFSTGWMMRGKKPTGTQGNPVPWIRPVEQGKALSEGSRGTMGAGPFGTGRHRRQETAVKKQRGLVRAETSAEDIRRNNSSERTGRRLRLHPRGYGLRLPDGPIPENKRPRIGPRFQGKSEGWQSWSVFSVLVFDVILPPVRFGPDSGRKGWQLSVSLFLLLLWSVSFSKRLSQVLQ
jgi:hypothetical protein